MSYAIIGFGNIGQALAKAFARSGIEVSVATTRDPESFASAAAAIGPEIIPTTLGEAVKADTVFLAVRYESHGDVAKALPSWKGKTIIDVTNAYGVSPEELGGQPSSTAVAQAFTGAKLVKGFNHLVAGVLEPRPGRERWQESRVPGERRRRRSSGDRCACGKSRFLSDPAWRAFGRWTARPGARKYLGSTDLQGLGQV